MSNVTLEAIEHLLDSKLDEKLDEKLAPIHETLRQHTAALEKLTSEKHIKDTNHNVSTSRINRLEDWGKQVGKKVKIPLEL